MGYDPCRMRYEARSQRGQGRELFTLDS
jgi:hypothetical protein